MKKLSIVTSRLNIQIPFIAGLGLLVSCSSHNAQVAATTSSASESASTEMSGGVDNPVFASSSRAPASVDQVPYAPARHAMTPPGRSQGPTTTAPTTTPATSATDPNAAHCNLRLDKIRINPQYSYSILDVLFRRATNQDVIQKRAQLGTFTGNADLDRQALQPWFGGVLGGQGSDLFDAAKTSKAYYRAMSFVNGATGPYTANNGQTQYFTYDDYLQNAKMAGVIAAMFATISDPECTRYIRKTADKVLSPEVAAELDDIPFVQAAQSAQAGRLTADFHELDANRTTLMKQQETLENDIDHKKDAAERETNQIQANLKKLYQQLKLKFVALPGCARLVTYHEQTDAIFSNEKDFLKSLTSDCRDQVNKALDAKNTEQVALTAKAAKFEQEKATNPSGNVTSVSQSNDLNAQLKALQLKIADLQSSLDWVNGVGQDSIVAEMDAMEKLLNRREEIRSPNYYAEDRQKIAEVQQRIDTDSTKWLTYGYAGGFEFLPSWQQRYRKLGAAPLSPASR